MTSLYRRARYLTSANDMAGLPGEVVDEVAFAGRSNAGKSSALNAITGQGGLARTSKTPGRTQLINFFALDEQRCLVDLPGYGFAKVPPKVQQHWQRLMADYLQKRASLRGLVMLMDVRHPLTELDRQMLDWCIQVQLPTHVLLTKADKLKRGQAASSLAKVRAALAAHSTLVSVQLFSALKKSGLDEARSVLERWLGVDAEDQA